MKKGKKMLIKEKFEEIVNLLEINFNGDSKKAAIHFCLCIVGKVEFENRPKEYMNSFYQNGIEISEFLFDLINYLAGYHELNCYLNVNTKLKKKKTAISKKI